MTVLDRFALRAPIIQAPMAGVSTPGMAAAVSNAGAMGSVAIGALGAAAARSVMTEVRALTDRAFNVNVFAHQPPRRDAVLEKAWLNAMWPLFEQFGAEPPDQLKTLYPSFNEDDALLAALVEAAPPVVSFHFGLPTPERTSALKAVGCLLIATATSLEEALDARMAGMDAVVAQGYEAGGHRGMFDPDAADAQLGTMALTRVLVMRGGLPVIAAGGIMDGAGVSAALELGAVAAQLGTAFIRCPESAADDHYRALLETCGGTPTQMTRVISGRPGRCLQNKFTAWEGPDPSAVPDYPVGYDAGKALIAVARAADDYGFGSYWAGEGAPLSRALPAAQLIDALINEMNDSGEPWPAVRVN